MGKQLLWIGRAAGAVGAVLTVVAAVMRVSGEYFLAGFQLGTMMQAGLAAMTLGCLCMLAVLTSNSAGKS